VSLLINLIRSTRSIVIDDGPGVTRPFSTFTVVRGSGSSQRSRQQWYLFPTESDTTAASSVSAFRRPIPNQFGGRIRGRTAALPQPSKRDVQIRNDRQPDIVVEKFRATERGVQ
jgi:hypothetical protein